MKTLVIYRNETPLHMGSGTEIGFVDMPIQREKHTGFPKVEASGIKGVFNQISKNREWFGEVEEETKKDEGNKVKVREGKLIFTDAKLLFLPVRSAKGLFAWVTCPYVLSRFFCDLEGVGEISKELKGFKKNLEENWCILSLNNSSYVISMTANEVSLDKKIYLEEYSFDEKSLEVGMKALIEYLFSQNKNNKADKYIYEKLKTDVLIVSDEIFSYFCDMGTEVTTRIRIGGDGVVEKGALFTEEFLPENSVLYNTVSDKYFIKPEPKVNGILEQFITEMKDETKGMIQLGGGTTIGKGITSYHFITKRGGRQ